MATIEGARVLGLQDSIGSLEIDKKADMIIVDINKPHLTPMYNPYSHLVYSARGNDVTHSIINGRLLMEDRKLLSIDLYGIMEKARQKSQDVRRWLQS